MRPMVASFLEDLFSEENTTTSDQLTFFSTISGSSGQEALQSQSGWVPLLLALLHEYTASNSPWQPYFSLWQDFRSLDHPMFW